MSFASLGLSEALVRAVEAAGYTEPTPVQQRAIPAVLQNRDLMVAAQTGTGKTGGFALPVLEKLFPSGQPDREDRHKSKQARVLVLTPTRELAAQVHDSFRLYARDLPLVSACIFGGVGMNPQIQKLAKGLDVLVACPGRLLDLVGQGAVDLSRVEILILDEADRMLDMGFIHDVKKVLAKLPKQRQNLLFSATFSQDITELAGKLLQDPERIEVTPPNTTVERIEQRVYRLPAMQKRALLAHLITQGAWEQVLVFTRTKHGANRLAEYLEKNGLPAAAIHGNKSQNARTKALADFKANAVRVLVATDIAARGLDIDQLPHVVNFELPNVEEDYVHRIGRTGRAGRSGEAISLVAPDEEKLLRSIERMTRQSIADGDTMGFDASAIEVEKPEVREPRKPRNPPRTERGERGERPAGERQGAPRKERTREGRDARPARDGAAKDAPRSPRGPRDSRDARPNPRGARPVSAPMLPPNRDPEEFLDDEIDNFGNRADYVSPHQNRPQGRGRPHTPRPAAATQARPAGQARGPRKPALTQAPSTATTQGRRPQGQGTGARQANGANRTRGPRDANPRRDAYREPTEAAPRRERQPVIIHKGERLPSLEQLESSTPRKFSVEKPALLTRNTDS